MGHVDLDPVGPVIELLASRLSRLDWAVYDLRPLRHIEFRRVALEVVASRRGASPSGNYEPRPTHATFLDCHLDTNLPIARAFALDITQRGKTLLQRPPRRNRRARRPQGKRIFQDVRVIAPVFRIFALEKNVSVGINQPRQHGAARNIDHRRPSGPFCANGIRDTLDATAANNYYLVTTRLVRFSVDEHARTNNSDSLRRRSLANSG